MHTTFCGDDSRVEFIGTRFNWSCHKVSYKPTILLIYQSKYDGFDCETTNYESSRKSWSQKVKMGIRIIRTTLTRVCIVKLHTLN